MPATTLARRAQYQVILFCLVLVPLCAARSPNDWEYSETHSDSRDFVAGGMLHVHLRVGDLHIKRGDGS